MQIDINIANNLTSEEKELFSILRNVIKEKSPATTLRVAGGWVRDKLLNLNPMDIDIMVDNITGEQMARLVTDYLNINPAHVIKSNPEKTKFLTTSTANIPLSSGKIKQVDFAQARQDVYGENSRVPELKPATAKQDAFRRDITINSMFWNLSTNKVEDFTGMGIKDLISNRIRTPLDPLKTFSDDPLRIFRVIRLAAKYNCRIDPETYAAMSDPSLRDIIRKKLAVERISTEFLKMLKNPNPQKSLELLKETGLLEDIISEAIKGTPYEGKLAELGMSQENPNHKLTLWAHTMEVVKGILEKYPEADPEKRIVMILTALMHDIGKTYKEIWAESKSHPGYRSYHGHEDESAKMIELILRYLRIEPYIQQVSNLAKEHMIPHQLLRDKGEKRALRRFIRKCGEMSLNWLDVFNLAIADAFAKDIVKNPNVAREYQDLENKLQEALASLSSVPNKPDLKPILNGNEIMKALNIRPGPHMKEMTEFVKELKDENPNATKEEAIIKLKEKFHPPEIKQASNDKKETSSTCPRHLLNSKIDEINQLFQEKKYYEILTIISQLKEEYGNDDNVIRLLAITIFKLLIRSEKYRYNDLIQYILDKAELSFFDHILCSYCIGILLLLETQTKDKVIKEIAQRMVKMSPETLKKVLALLPEKVFRPELKKKIEKMLK